MTAVRLQTERSLQQALSLSIIKAIVKRYGGTCRVDLATDTVFINVDKDKEAECAKEIEERVGAMCG